MFTHLDLPRTTEREEPRECPLEGGEEREWPIRAHSQAPYQPKRGQGGFRRKGDKHTEKDGVATDPFTRGGAQKEQNEAKVALGGMELWMSVTHAGDAQRIGRYLFFLFETQLVEGVSPSVKEE